MAGFDPDLRPGESAGKLIRKAGPCRLAALILLPYPVTVVQSVSPLPEGYAIRQTFWHFAGATRHGETFY